MTRTIVIRPEAEREIEAAFSWYEQACPGLGMRFLELLDKTFVRIADGPERFTAAGGFKRATLRTFPFCIYFRASGDAVVVVAVLHARRSQRRLVGRG